jgi:5-formyltetrahydrofolate cyclo-ligase
MATQTAGQTADIEAEKARLRTAAFSARGRLDAAERAEFSKTICRYFSEGVALRPQDVVACYWPIRDEVDCQPLLTRLVDAGQPVCLPVVTAPDAPLEMRLWGVGQALYPAGFGTLAPDDLSAVAAPDVIVLPLVGFDATGTRLGYGGGHYDRTLAALEKRPRLIGLAFSVQELAYVPRAAHDVPLDAVVTELGLRAFGEAG